VRWHKRRKEEREPFSPLFSSESELSSLFVLVVNSRASFEPPLFSPPPFLPRESPFDDAFMP